MSVASETGSFFGVPKPLSAAEADRRLEKAVHEHERAEKLVCFYLHRYPPRRALLDIAAAPDRSSESSFGIPRGPASPTIVALLA